VNPIHTRQTGRSLIHIVAFGELAESKLDLLQSGLHLMVVGRLNQRQWQTPEGKKRTRTEVIAIDLQKVEVRHQTACLPTGKMDSIERGEEDEETC
jgi:single-strand DNA-binding protein